MTRPLDTKCLAGAIDYYAGQFLLPERRHPHNRERLVGGPRFVVKDLYNLTFKDEFEVIVEGILGTLQGPALDRFVAQTKEVFEPRDDQVFEELLREKLAVDLNGDHIEGAIGTTQVHQMRIVGRKAIVTRSGEAKVVDELWPIYAGEQEERANNSKVVDPLPDTTQPLAVGAAVSRLSYDVTAAGLNAMADKWDDGTDAAIIQGRTGAAPATVETAATGTLLFQLTGSDPFFGNAADQNPDAQVDAAAITSDSSADATGTLGYCRDFTTNDGATPLTALADGNAGTVDEVHQFNTAEIVAGAQVDMTSRTIKQLEAGT